MVKLISEEEFEQKVRGSKQPAVVDFYADWCGPCQMLGPVVEQLGAEYEGKVGFFKLNADEAGRLSGEFGVSAIPCLVILREGKEIGRIVGYSPKEVIRAKIEEALAGKGVKAK